MYPLLLLMLLCDWKLFVCDLQSDRVCLRIVTCWSKLHQLHLQSIRLMDPGVRLLCNGS